MWKCLYSFTCWLGNPYKHLGLKEHCRLSPHHFLNPYISHLQYLPSSLATCDLATQALSPSDLTSSSQQEKETLLCPKAEEKQRWDTQNGGLLWCWIHHKSMYKEEFWNDHTLHQWLMLEVDFPQHTNRTLLERDLPLPTCLFQHRHDAWRRGRKSMAENDAEG